MPHFSVAFLTVLFLSCVTAQNCAVNTNDNATLVCNNAFTRGQFWPVSDDPTIKPLSINFVTGNWDNQTYSVIRTNSTVTLTILSIQKEQAGLYICLDPFQSIAEIANVIVMGKKHISLMLLLNYFNQWNELNNSR